jgi:trehalose/maltose hydrolase-like predicted phosphorylase
MSVMKYDLGTGPDTNWLIAESDFDPNHLGKGEAIFCLGNGYLGQRAALEEEYVGQTRDFFVNGTFHRFDQSEVTELPNLPDLTQIQIMINGARFSLCSGRLLRYVRFLNLKTGELNRIVEWESPAGDRLRLTFRRFASLENEHLLAAKMEITPINGDVQLQIESGINGRVSNSGSQHFCEGAMRIYENTVLEMVSETCNAGIVCGLHTAHRFRLNGEEFQPAMLPVIERRLLNCRYTIALKANQTLEMEKISCVHTSFDQAYVNLSGSPVERIKIDGKTLVLQGLQLGYEALSRQSACLWNAVWQKKDINLESNNPFDQLALRFAVYHMIIMAHPTDCRVGIGAKSLTGEGYKGHSFWDTEIFLLPYYAFSQPETARNLLLYRYYGLEGARRKARENGYQGAMYPWETANTDDGEVTPLMGGADVVTGEQLPILTGSLEQHISADVAFAVWQYFQITGDQSFLDDYGYEIILETARFWTSRAMWDAGKNAYVIDDVIGPDEYKEHVNNNAYTNYLAHYNMFLALSVLDTLEKRNDAVYGRLSAAIPFQETRSIIREVAEKLYLPKAEPDGVIPQFEGFMDLAPLDIRKYKQAGVVGTIIDDYNMEQIGKMQVCKQGDLLVLLLLLGDRFPPNTLADNFSYYEEKTLHDSSLSKSTHCILACDLKRYDMAGRLFQGACNTDLGPLMSTSDMGIHSASMGGIWQCVVFGGGGVRIRDGVLHIAPHLLPEWRKLSFALCYQGGKLSVTADPQGVTVKNAGDVDITIAINGAACTLRAGETCVSSRPPEPCG